MVGEGDAWRGLEPDQTLERWRRLVSRETWGLPSASTDGAANTVSRETAQPISPGQDARAPRLHISARYPLTPHHASWGPLGGTLDAGRTLGDDPGSSTPN